MSSPLSLTLPRIVFSLHFPLLSINLLPNPRPTQIALSSPVALLIRPHPSSHHRTPSRVVLTAATTCYSRRAIPLEAVLMHAPQAYPASRAPSSNPTNTPSPSSLRPDSSNLSCNGSVRNADNESATACIQCHYQQLIFLLLQSPRHHHPGYDMLIPGKHSRRSMETKP